MEKIATLKISELGTVTHKNYQYSSVLNTIENNRKEMGGSHFGHFFFFLNSKENQNNA